jgi:E3 ubiquitin-protein ligase NEDD4
MKEVNNDNLDEYLEAVIRYRMLNRTKQQLRELLLGFYDVVPEPALTVFDPAELELILCGLPEINLEDWKANTLYRGLFESAGEAAETVRWFWEVVEEDMDQEMRARLLQFCTGTSGVPARGFSHLQGQDGSLKKFTIQGIEKEQTAYPVAHTCFNRIDLPAYAEKEELKERLITAITHSFTGFDLE